MLATTLRRCGLLASLTLLATPSFGLQVSEIGSAPNQANPCAELEQVLPGGPLLQSGGLSGYRWRNGWMKALGEDPTLVSFDQYPDGALVTGTGLLAGDGVADCYGTAFGSPIEQYTYSENTLPFTMFTAGTLPSAPNYFANNREPGPYSTGEFTLVFVQPRTAVGCVIADAVPLDGFRIELFSDAAGTQSLGSVTLPPRTTTLGEFSGVLSSTPFLSAKFIAVSRSDSWGIDNLEHYGPSPAASAGSSCAPETSSGGCATTLSITGGQVTASGVEGGQPGFFVMAPAGRAPTAWSQGSSCSLTPTGRGRLAMGTGAPGTCNGVIQQELSALPPTGPGVPVSLQLWYRERRGTGTFRVSDTVEVTLEP